MAAKMEVNDIDFFNTDAHWDYSIDDITLSQVCGDIENENDAFEKLEDLTLSQAFDSLGMKSMLRWTLLFMGRASKT